MTRRRFPAVYAISERIDDLCARLRQIADGRTVPYEAPVAAGYVSVEMPHCTRAAERPPRGSTVPLIAAGWRFVGVPRYYADRDGFDHGSTVPRLHWDRRVAAIPPEDSGVKARVFARREEALSWAKGLEGNSPRRKV